jgi:SSS family solute:Na+ symporter
MWSVAMTDFFQMAIIMIGMLIVGYVISGMVPGGAVEIVQHAADNGKLEFFPAFRANDAINFAGMVGFLSALLTMGFGSIPQQDVFQRVMSAKDEKTAKRSAVFGGSLYFVFAFVPIFLGYAATFIDPTMVETALGEGGDTQLVLPNLILNHAPVFAQVLFFGALLSAIMSTASGTLLAPSTMFVENILKPFFKKVSDARFLMTIRTTVVVFAVLVTLFALNSETGIFGMVENAYKVTFAGAFVPLFAGIYWKRANSVGALLSMTLGIVTWLSLEITNPEATVPPQFAGFLFGIVGMVVGSYLPKILKLELKTRNAE